MTMRTCFYPILGDKIFGILGDLIDILCIICTMFGVCTSLGLGVMQLINGIHRIDPSIPEDTCSYVVAIWCITGLATLSVISGIKLGIRRLSETCFGIGKSESASHFPYFISPIYVVNCIMLFYFTFKLASIKNIRNNFCFFFRLLDYVHHFIC